jgi:putative FmdB family regulatory protein
MPIYEYVCGKCGRKTEVIQRMGDKPLTHCPNCGGKVKKAISAPAIQFKGSGWYVTDYGAGASRASKSESEGESAKSETKSEPAEKSEKPSKTEKPEKAEKKKSSKKGSEG